MAHKDWCGLPCAECPSPCTLDTSIPCSPDCEALNWDGTRDIQRCEESACDAIVLLRKETEALHREEVPIKIVDIVKFNDYHAFVWNKGFALTYEKHGDLLIGSDDTQTFFSVLCHEYSFCKHFAGKNLAFGGRKFELQMKDGSVTHCYGQYWTGGHKEAEKILGITLRDITHSSIDSLRKQFVFHSGLVDGTKLQAMIDDFQSNFPDYKPWEYQEYETHIKKKESVI